MEKIFENTEIAFALKSNSDLKKAHFLFSMMAKPAMVRLGTSLTNFSLKIGLPVKGLIKNTIFKQFCGGVTEDDCLPIINQLSEKGVMSLLDYSVEGKEDEEDFDNAMRKKIALIDFADSHNGIPFASLKPTALGRFALWQKVSEGKELSSAETAEWKRIENRFDAICKNAHDKNIPVLIDAEESWMQDAADRLTEEMMLRYNKENTIVYNTIQCYRWDRLEYTKHLQTLGKEKGIKVGAKIVRGAYMEKENERAEEMGYRSPICESKEATDVNFDKVLSYILDHLDTFSLFVGSHNESSTYLAMELMKERQIVQDHEKIWFGQLYGMSDQISYNLAFNKYNTVKLIPFGPVKEVIPYLIRRAEENTSVAGQTGRELTLIKAELRRRKL
ncbi:proline dehydrogenase [Leptobacterium flavescens]|uniref:Proline dehydrogenase n=1 Tax=Leptobacterium flavescens TaxID=472055 RepID=A0A6P0UK83_9FLAO|nr:proline dehydrogenase family protein [Leptobacterium flavescens]NER13781.1 proline dehydrogenase [Leptobacterium flavescens]